MSQQELLSAIVRALDEAGVEFMLTGSVASSFQGEPRATHDIDLVVLMTPEAAGPLLAAFPPPDYYLSEQAVREAIRQRSMFNLLHLPSGGKVDFWMLTDEPFDQSRFARKRPIDLQGVRLNVSAPEDTILVKLHWSKAMGGSDKQFTDIVRVYEVQGPQLDRAYLEHWARQLDVEDLWRRVQAEAEPL